MKRVIISRVSGVAYKDGDKFNLSLTLEEIKNGGIFNNVICEKCNKHFNSKKSLSVHEKSKHN